MNTKIKKLWGEVYIDWQLNPFVNILIDINGSGKTTLLSITEFLSKPQQRNKHQYNSVKYRQVVEVGVGSH